MRPNRLAKLVKLCRRILAFTAVFFSALICATQALRAQSLIDIYSFQGGDVGGNPAAGVLVDIAGDLYGTTSSGGTYGLGTVFKVDKNGNHSVLYSFQGSPDGASPQSPLVEDSMGNLYGTTAFGGTGNCTDGGIVPGCGTVFKIDSSGHETVMHNFSGGSDGESPLAGLVLDSSGKLYGSTSRSTGIGTGTLFEIDLNGKETVLHAFVGYPDDGGNPQDRLILDSSGNIYGATAWGGSGLCTVFGQKLGCGTIFELDPTGKETLLYEFGPEELSLEPVAPGALSRDSQGNLYFVTRGGGLYGKGGIFRLDTSGNLSGLYGFTGGNDGENPKGLVLDNAGNFYGIAEGGAGGGGTLFTLGAPGFTLLYSFPQGAGGSFPQGITGDAAGHLFGTTLAGGLSGCAPEPGCGLIFELIANSTFRVAPILAVVPNSTSVLTSESLLVTITVSGSATGPTPTGAVILIGGNYQSAETALNGGTAAIIIPAGSLAPGSDDLTVTYTPDAAASQAYTIASGAAVVSVTTVSYSMTATSVTITPGAEASSTVTISSSTGFVGTVTLTCAVTASPVGSIDPPSCTSTQTVTLGGNANSGAASVNVNTTGPSTSATLRPPMNHGVWSSASLCLLVIGFVALSLPKRKNAAQSLVVGLPAIALLLSFIACGGRGASPVQSKSGTSPGNYTITVTGTGDDSQKLKETTTFVVTVN